MNIIAQANHWASLGMSPIPLQPKSKVPALSSWKEWVSDLPPRPMIDLWFRRDGVNLGLVIRKDFIVVDFDNTPEYMVWSIKNPKVASSYTIRTNRGFHVYYHSQHKPDKTLLLSCGELKATGYVVAPPSIHPSGRTYEVWKETSILEIDSWTDLGVSEMKPLNSVPVRVGKLRRDGFAVSDKIKNRLSAVEYVMRLTDVFDARKNGMWIARCPFHDDVHPSMVVDEDKAWCFNPQCRAGRQQMDVINLWAMWNNLSNADAIRQMAADLL